MTRTAIPILTVFVALISANAFGQTDADACNQAASEPVAYFELSEKPFLALPTKDGCWVFVSQIPDDEKANGEIAVLRRAAGTLSLARIFPISGAPTHMVLSPDGRVLFVADENGVVFIDAVRLISGEGDPVLGSIDDQQGIPPDTALYMGPQRTSETHEPGSTYVNVTADGRFLFVSDEWTQAITVIDLRQGFSRSAIVGRIPVGVLPVALTFSRDQRFLFTTSQIGLQSYGWPVECKDERAPSDQTAPVHRQGAILVIDVAIAESDPSHAVISKAPARCAPVRFAISPDGKSAYVTARNSNAVLVFDTAKLVSDPLRASIGEVPVGTAPVGIDLIEGGRRIVVTNSDRFAGGASEKQSLTVIDAAKVASGAAAVIGPIEAGAFPREIRVTADQRTMLVTNFASKTVEIIDIQRLPK